MSETQENQRTRAENECRLINTIQWRGSRIVRGAQPCERCERWPPIAHVNQRGGGGATRTRVENPAVDEPWHLFYYFLVVFSVAQTQTRGNNERKLR